jgi:alpha-L-rhamnosidase
MFNNDAQNATTVWESFHALLNGSIGTDSLNHHMYNSIGAWFYRYLAGVQLNGFAEDILIHPRLTTLLMNVDAEVHTIYGSIFVSYEQHIEGNAVTYDVTIPNSLYSIVTFEPIRTAARCISIEESGVLVWHPSSALLNTNVSGILWIQPDSIIENAMSVRIQSGSYHFKVQWT